MSGRVLAVHSSGRHAFSKEHRASIEIVEGIGVAGDAHSGPTMKHRSRFAKGALPNLRQVHLIHAELFEELKHAGFDVRPGDLGENVTTLGVDLLSLSEGTVLRLGASAAVRVTGLRNPCVQLDRFKPGLMKACLARGPDGALVRKAGVMSVALFSGTVRSDDAIMVELPKSEDYRALRPV